MSNEKLTEALLAKKPFLSFYQTPGQLQKAFRFALSTCSEAMDNYLSSPVITNELIDILLSPGTKPNDLIEVVTIFKQTNFFAAQEVLLSTPSLDRMFQYFNPPPGNLYHLDTISKLLLHLFQNKTEVMFSYISTHPNAVASITKHIGTYQIWQLLSAMVNMERQMRELESNICQWTQETAFISNLLSVLKNRMEETYDNIQKILSDLAQDKTGQYIKNVLLNNIEEILTVVDDILRTKFYSTSAVVLLDNVIFSTMCANLNSDPILCQQVAKKLSRLTDTFTFLLDSESVSFCISGSKLINVLIKNKLLGLLQPDGARKVLLNMMRFPWSNVMHNVNQDTFCYIFGSFNDSDYDVIISKLLEDNFLHLLATIFCCPAHGYAGHVRAIVTAMAESLSPIKEKWITNEIFQRLVEVTIKNQPGAKHVLKEAIEGYSLSSPPLPSQKTINEQTADVATEAVSTNEFTQ
eukprot:TRINITY_DN10116_c0_g1_i3.p1 TRINITY_DN10116_c0_g1~~TRINITY_DN10116_c0_g1_i3.p1  ORF type:complete len:482 (+),score=86.53 TRINITY_DN10116_c0_g1_i3:49-1446(+)